MVLHDYWTDFENFWCVELQIFFSNSFFDAKNNLLIENTFYSIGGGFIIDESSTLNKTSKTDYKVPFEFDSGNQLLSLCDENNLKIYEIVRQNEESFNPDSDIDSLIINIWKTMNSSIYNGMTNSGFLKGNLNWYGLYRKIIFLKIS